VLDDLAPLPAGITRHLDLLEHARRKLLFHDTDAVAVAVRTCLDLAVLGAGAVALLTNDLLVPVDLGRGAVVKVAQCYADLELDVGTFALLVSKVATATEEAREEVKWVVLLVAPALLVALDAFMPVSIVYFPQLGVDEGLVRLGDFDELVMGCLVAA
jgi:hypothetical protein